MVNTGRGITDRFIFFILPYVYNKYIILVKSEKNINIKKKGGGNSLAAQWLGLHASTAGGQDSIPGWELSYHKSHSSAKKKKKRIHGEKENLHGKRKGCGQTTISRGALATALRSSPSPVGNTVSWMEEARAGKLVARGGEGAVPLVRPVQQHAGPLSPERPLVSPLARCRTGEAASQRHSPRTGVPQTQGQGAVVKAPWTRFRKKSACLACPH